MNINNDYQKLRGQITSFPTGEIIEPNRKYLESNLFYPAFILLPLPAACIKKCTIEGLNIF